MFYSQTKSGADVFPNLVMMVLLAYCRNENKNNSENKPIYELLQDTSVIDNQKQVSIDKRTFAYVTADSMTFKEVDKCHFTYSMSNSIPHNLSTFLLLDELGMGSSGKVFLTASGTGGKSFGTICAMKIYFAERNLKIDKLPSNEDADSESDASPEDSEEVQTRNRELSLWQKFYKEKYGNFVHTQTFNGHCALSLPYGTEIPEESRPQYYDEISAMLTMFAEKGFRYNSHDVRWSHVLLDANGNLFLADLESLRVKEEKENISEIIKSQMDQFEKRSTA